MFPCICMCLLWAAAPPPPPPLDPRPLAPSLRSNIGDGGNKEGPDKKYYDQVGAFTVFRA